ncbi:ABC-type proline/glycine betaine transport system permease subunit [Desulfitispora alkaliphila]|uniref:hypothetical protein n=1 Tax=Desulfitispora alkaliphila TaxID=622674 RepID=UPI003D1ABC85
MIILVDRIALIRAPEEIQINTYKLSLKMPPIMTRFNQTIMLPLAMMAKSAMFEAGGLGREVWHGTQRLQV